MPLYLMIGATVDSDGPPVVVGWGGGGQNATARGAMAANSVSPLNFEPHACAFGSSQSGHLQHTIQCSTTTTQVRETYEYVPRPLAHIGVEARTPHQWHLRF